MRDERSPEKLQLPPHREVAYDDVPVSGQIITDFHVMRLGSRGASGSGLVFVEQIAIQPDGRTSVGCGGIWDESPIDSLSRVVRNV